MFGGQLLIGTLLIVVCVAFHICGLVFLAGLLKRLSPSVERLGNLRSTVLLMSMAVIVIIGIHTVEVWGWAAMYYAVGEFTEFERALYFSAVTATTLGYGDIVLSERWQLLATFEAMGGLILFGASTAFLLGLTRSLFSDVSVRSDS